MSNNNKQLILFALYCLLFISTVRAEQDSAQCGYEKYVRQGSHTMRHHRKDYNEKVFVQVNPTHYYEATISTTSQHNIKIQILDQNVKVTILNYNLVNKLVFLDAYQNVIFAKQVDDKGVILSYWVLIITYDNDSDSFTLEQFAVSSYVDDQFFYFNGVGDFYEILEYNQQQNWVAIAGGNKQAYVTYKVNLAQQINVFLMINWVKLDCQTIQGGNSRVHYDKTDDAFLVDTYNCREDHDDPTIFNKVPVCNLTKLPLYGHGRTVNLAGWYFQYINPSQKKNALTTFRYQGYGDLPIAGQANMKSDGKIKYYYDEYNFFIAISNCDIYLTNVYYEDDVSSYKDWSGLLSETCQNKHQQQEVLQNWRNIVEIVFIDNKFYFITKNKFFVYGMNPTYFTKVFESDCIYNDKDATVALFVEINKYMTKAAP